MIRLRGALCAAWWRWIIEHIEIDSKQKRNVKLYPKNKHDNYAEGTCYPSHLLAFNSRAVVCVDVRLQYLSDGLESRRRNRIAYCDLMNN